jgi:uncharacterized protein
LHLEIPVSPGALVVAMVVTVIAAIVQGSIGIGFAVLSVPVLALVDPALSPVPQLLLSLPLTVYMAWRERHAIHLKSMAWVLAGRIPGAALGMFLLGIASAKVLDAFIGGVVLAGTLITATDLKVRRTPATELIAGTVAGVTGLVSAIGGPPLALLYRNDKGEVLRANLAAIFTIGLLISIAGRALVNQISRSDIILSILLFPPLVIGIYFSRGLIKYFEGPALKISVLVLSALAAIGLILRALT